MSGTNRNSNGYATASPIGGIGCQGRNADDLTTCKGLESRQTETKVENTYVVFGENNVNKGPVTETPYDFPDRGPLKELKCENSMKTGQTHDTLYDYPRSDKNITTTDGATGFEYDLVRMPAIASIKSSEPVYDSPKSNNSNVNNKMHIVSDVDRPYMPMTVSLSMDTKPAMDTTDDVYVLPSTIESEDSQVCLLDKDTKENHCYSNVCVGPYENI